MWPLDQAHGGKEKCDLLDMTLNSEMTSAGLHLTGLASSNAVVNNYPADMISKEFSWMARVKVSIDKDGPLFSWKKNNEFATHIWVVDLKLYTRVVFVGNACGTFHTISAQWMVLNRWYTLAVSYNAQTGTHNTWVDDEASVTVRNYPCGGDILADGDAYIGGWFVNLNK